ncbi:HPr family phosphocarrier protein [Niallia sp. 03133]|uniref:HPr family phosphocarrier protein n=1 Tax=Niallia sp. 03133 TaxID=3458060 RepID=UPI004043A5F9
MIEKQIIVFLEHGIQSRNATEFVQKASVFSSEIGIMKNGRRVAAKSIMGVMSLAIRQKEEIMLLADGMDEVEAIATLEKFLSSKG